MDETLYRAGVIAYRAGLQRGSSLVDHVSFECMREDGISDCFGFDRDFEDAGFTLVPGRMIRTSLRRREAAAWTASRDAPGGGRGI